jgi:hypothetical protein
MYGKKKKRIKYLELHEKSTRFDCLKKENNTIFCLFVEVSWGKTRVKCRAISVIMLVFFQTLDKKLC